MAQTSERHASWGHWGITFFWQTPNQYAPDKIEGTLYFPVSSQGPHDVDQRPAYLAAVANWQERGILPDRLTPFQEGR
jgi:hypothetical protein